MLHTHRGAQRRSTVVNTLILFFALAIASPRIFASAEEPYIDGIYFVMPVVQVIDTPFRIVWQIVDTGGIVDLLLYDYEQLPEADTLRAPSFYGSILNVPSATLDGVSYWAEFSIDSEQPVIFRLSSVEANNAGNSGVQGKWRIVEEVDERACGGDLEIVIHDLRLQENGGALTVISNAGTFGAELDGNILQWSGSFPEDGGTVTTAIDVEFADSLDSLVGASQWNWSNGSLSCAGVSIFTGELLHN